MTPSDTEIILINMLWFLRYRFMATYLFPFELSTIFILNKRTALSIYFLFIRK